MNSTLVGLLYVFRHGQRPPYPPPFAKSWAEAAAAGWTNRADGFPSMTPQHWNMTAAAFYGTELTPHGHLLHRHLGEHVALRSAPLGDPCTINSMLVADDSVRDEQSAHAWASGFFPPACAAAKAKAILVANGSIGLQPATSDHFDTGCGTGPDEATAEQMIGSTAALTSRYRPQFRPHPPSPPPPGPQNKTHPHPHHTSCGQSPLASCRCMR